MIVLLLFLTLQIRKNLVYTALLRLNRSYYSNVTNKDHIPVVPVCSYLNADTDKLTIFKDNKGEVGIYR